jgi:hypothetical protein
MIGLTPFIPDPASQRTHATAVYPLLLHLRVKRRMTAINNVIQAGLSRRLQRLGRSVFVSA